MSNLPKPEPNERPTLKQGDSEEWTVFLQDELNGCGYGPLDLDGIFGPNTLEEVKKFQLDNSLTVNGIVDATTWTALDKHEKLFGWQSEWPSGSLHLTGIGGVDTLKGVQPSLIPPVHKYMGTQPRFWGRYFQGNTRDGEYLHADENNPLHDAGIRVIPISRQTNKVGGTEQDGMELGTSHAKDVLATFGEDYLVSQGDSFYIFLDVEGVDDQPSLSKEFYQGWSNAVANASHQVKFLPCIYINAKGDPTSQRNLSAAMKEGAQCHGLWVANYDKQPQISPWNREKVKPVIAVPCKVLLHQYIGDIDPETGTVTKNPEKQIYDFNQINPFLDDPELILQRLILPPTVKR